MSPLSAAVANLSESGSKWKPLRDRLDREYIEIALPAFVSLAADPLASLVDAMYVGRLGAVQQAGMGIAISAQYSVAKLYNDPLLKTSTSLVAGKSGEELSASVATAISTAMVIGVLQCLVFLLFSSPILTFMGVSAVSEMREPALSYLKWRAIGIPAATVLLVSNGIFRGRGDTKTPLYCTSVGNLVNILLDPILIFSCGMGCAGAGAATAISQWVTALPLLYLLNKSVPFTLRGGNSKVWQTAFQSYFQAGGLILLRTIAKISAYTFTSAAAARLGTVPMAAYSLTFNLGFATSQLCESISVAVQALLARDMPFNTEEKRISAAHVMQRSLLLGLVVSSGLTVMTFRNMQGVISQMSKSVPVQQTALAIMPVVLMTQIFKGLAYSTGGILLGGLDWGWSTASMVIAACLSITCTLVLPPSLWNIWVSLSLFMAVQVAVASFRFLSGKGPWRGVAVWSR
jgi:putative MATE family efflux protein